jgi:hypothetical protein
MVTLATFAAAVSVSGYGGGGVYLAARAQPAQSGGGSADGAAGAESAVLAEIEALLGRGESIDAADAAGETRLHKAAFQGYQRVVRFLRHFKDTSALSGF